MVKWMKFGKSKIPTTKQLKNREKEIEELKQEVSQRQLEANLKQKELELKKQNYALQHQRRSAFIKALKGGTSKIGKGVYSTSKGMLESKQPPLKYLAKKLMKK